jgi:signal peptidase II
LKTKKLFFLFIPALIVWIVDQISKHVVRYSLELHRFDIIEGWLAFNYTQNPGMALGMDWLSTPVISSVAILATIGILAYILKTLHVANLSYLFCMGLILGGALGNITDRLVMGIIEGYGGVLHGHVIDFIHFNLTINDTAVFPYIFNVADMAISTSIIAMLIFHKKIMPVDKNEPDETEKVENRAGLTTVPKEIRPTEENINTGPNNSEDNLS